MSSVRRTSGHRLGRWWRFFLTVMGVIFRHPIAGVVLIPILPDERYVFIRKYNRDNWCLPGGFIDWGEDVPAAARRELREETGLELVRINRLVGTYSSPHRDPRAHSITIVVAVEARGQMETLDKDEVAEVRAFAREEIPFERMQAHSKSPLADFLEGRTAVR